MGELAGMEKQLNCFGMKWKRCKRGSAHNPQNKREREKKQANQSFTFNLWLIDGLFVFSAAQKRMNKRELSWSVVCLPGLAPPITFSSIKESRANNTFLFSIGWVGWWLAPSLHSQVNGLRVVGYGMKSPIHQLQLNPSIPTFLFQRDWFHWLMVARLSSLY